MEEFIKEFRCSKCGKICKSEAGLKSHMRSCKIGEPVEVIIDMIIDEVSIKVPDVEVSKEVATEKVSDELTIKEELEHILGKLGGRRAQGIATLEKMFEIFKRIYPQSKVHLNYDCSTCCNHIYRRLRDYYKNIK